MSGTAIRYQAGGKMSSSFRKLTQTASLASLITGCMTAASWAQEPAPRKPSPVEYVRECRNPLWPNAGGFVVPGTGTCLRIFGQARFDYRLRQQFFRMTAPSGYRSTATFGLDAITPTEFGQVRTVAQMSFVYRSGEQRNATAVRQGFAIDGDFSAVQGAPGPLRGGGTEVLYSGFVQFAGFTAGRTVSFFDPFFVPDIVGTAWRAAPFNVNLIAYTAVLGPGLTASASAEDPTTRRLPIVNGSRGRTNFNYATEATNVLNQGGVALPHFVGSLQLDQAWGSAKLAGVVTNIRPSGLLPATGPLATVPSAKFGFAVVGAVKVNLPMIAPGDNLALIASYGEGAVHYSFSTFQLGSTAIQSIGGAGRAVGDAVFDNPSGRLKLTKHTLVAAGFQHFWVPTLSTTIHGSFRSYNVPFDPVDIRDTHRDANVWTLGANLIWTPVRGLSFALEGAYIVTDPKGRVPNINRNADVTGAVLLNCNATGSNCFTKSSQSNVMGHFRVVREF
jgi:Porin subfamily